MSEHLDTEQRAEQHACAMLSYTPTSLQKDDERLWHGWAAMGSFFRQQTASLSKMQHLHRNATSVNSREVWVSTWYVQVIEVEMVTHLVDNSITVCFIDCQMENTVNRCILVRS